MEIQNVIHFCLHTLSEISVSLLYLTHGKKMQLDRTEEKTVSCAVIFFCLFFFAVPLIHKGTEKNTKHLKVKQNLSFLIFLSYFKFFPSFPNKVKQSSYSWHSETSDSSGVGLPSDFFHPMTYLLTAPCLWYGFETDPEIC